MSSIYIVEGRDAGNGFPAPMENVRKFFESERKLIHFLGDIISTNSSTEVKKILKVDTVNLTVKVVEPRLDGMRLTVEPLEF